MATVTEAGKRNLRIVHTCSAHRHGDGRVFQRACRSLAKAGYDVHLIARGDRAGVEFREGVTVHTLPPSGRLQRIIERTRIARMAAELQPDLVHVHEPELLGAVIRALPLTPVIWDVHECFMEVILEREWIPALARRFTRAAWDFRERQLLSRCAAIVAATPQIAVRYEPLHPLVVVVANFPEAPAIDGQEPCRDGRTCAYAGGIMASRGIFQAVQAIAILLKRGLEVPFNLAGPADTPDRVPALLAEAAALGVGHLVRYLGVLSPEEAREMTRAASIALIPNLPFGNSRFGVASKMIESMGFGMPVVYPKIPSYLAIMEKYGAGVPVDTTSPEAIADGIEYLIRHPREAAAMGENGREAVRKDLHWGKEEAKLLALYARLLRGKANINTAKEAEHELPEAADPGSAHG